MNGALATPQKQPITRDSRELCTHSVPYHSSNLAVTRPGVGHMTTTTVTKRFLEDDLLVAVG